MSIPKEPRQIMINLMYLVLTALLALNVSNEILNAFKVLAKGIQDSNSTIDEKTHDVYNIIKANADDPAQHDKVLQYKLKADEVVRKADSMVAYLGSWEKRVIAESGGYTKGETKDDSEIARPDNIDATTDLLVEKKGGDTVKQRIIALRKFMLETVPADSAIIRRQMPLDATAPPKSDHNPTRNWSVGYFEHMPTVAAIAMFSKFQNDVRTSEALVINTLYNEAHTKDLKFDTSAAIAVPTTSYALDGQKVEANILIAAFNKHNSPTVTIAQGGGTKKDAVNGIVHWETIASGTGLQTVKGKITLSEENGASQVKDWSFSYMVGSTGASMQLDKMNVFYIGVDNPITIAAAGYSIEDVSLDIPGAVIKPNDTAGKGHYLIQVSTPGTVQANVMADTHDQGKKVVGGLKIRVKKIPNPVASLGGLYGGGFPVGKFRIQVAPAAVLDNFDFEARFLVTGFTYSTQPKGKDYQGPYTVHTTGGARFRDNPDVKKLEENAKVGDKVFIEEIKVIGPDKIERKLPGTLLFTLTP